MEVPEQTGSSDILQLVTAQDARDKRPAFQDHLSVRVEQPNRSKYTGLRQPRSDHV